MINKDFAEKFIERVSRYTKFNVNIMDEKGVIIASRDRKRIGQYHEIAHRLITGTEEMIDTTGMSFPNVLPGINMIIMTGGKREGVVGVTGDPQEVRPVALMVKMAFETMLKYERQQEQQRIRANKKEHFIYLLTQVEHSDPEELRSYARELGYPEEAVRVPILLRLASGKPDEILPLLRGSPLHTRKDLSFALDGQHILVYKTVETEKKEAFSDFRNTVREYLGALKRRQGQTPCVAAAYVGSFQDSYPQYYYGYRHCKWLEQHVLPDSDGPVFFYDHFGEYIRSTIPFGELQRAFYVYRSRIPEQKLQSFTETIGALIRTNYNFAKAAEQLYIHKNTLVYRYNNMKAVLGADPLASSDERVFIEAFYTYLMKSSEN